ncbi:MAG: NADH-quinone oxidoreductase subunit J [Firmicutes bacterium]|nr:NADH-quinone oxidoreductase subunit J [Bacillota bacterium]
MSWVVAAATVMTLAGAAGVLRARIPVHAVLALVLNLVGLAALFIALDAEFMGLIQVIVYAGAVMVLFLFVISLLSARNTPLERRPSLLAGQEPLGVAVGALLVAALAGAIFGQPLPEPASIYPGFGTVKAFGAALFYEHVFVLQLAALLLFLAAVGVVVLLGRRGPGR